MKYFVISCVLLIAGQAVAQEELPVPTEVVTHIVKGEAGEPRHTQPSRDDKDNSISDTTETYWRAQPRQVTQTLTLTDGVVDLVYVQVFIDGKPDIVEQHVNDNGTIDWGGVAGENNSAHDHWPNGFGIVRIENFDNEEDRVIVVGHTVDASSEPIRPEQWLDGDELFERYAMDQYGDLDMGLESFPIRSDQGNNGGAHDEDFLGIIQFVDDNPNEITTIQSNAGVTETIDEFRALVEEYAALEPEDDPAPEPGEEDDLDFLLVLFGDDFFDFLGRFGFGEDWFLNHLDANQQERLFTWWLEKEGIL